MDFTVLMTSYTRANSKELALPTKIVHQIIIYESKKGIYFCPLATKRAVIGAYIQPFALFNGEQADKEQLAQQLLKVLDARGLLVVYSEIPDTPNYIDSLSGLPQYILFNDLPEVYLRKVGSEWLFSESTIEQIPVLYRATFSSTLEAFIDRLPLVAKTEWMGLYVWQVIGLVDFIGTRYLNVFLLSICLVG